MSPGSSEQRDDSHPADAVDPVSSSDADALYELIQAGGLWRIAPEWVPRTYAEPTKELADRVRHGLRRLDV